MSDWRPERPRHHDLIREHLAVWASIVERAERADDFDDPWESACPTCAQTWDAKFGSRERLEAIIRKGGRRGREVAAKVAPLDDRYERATAYMGSVHRGDHWWEHRRIDHSHPEVDR